MLEGIASALPEGDQRLGIIRLSAEAHQRAGLAAVTGEHYEGGHWLGSFAVYLVTSRGIQKTEKSYEISPWRQIEPEIVPPQAPDRAVFIATRVSCGFTEAASGVKHLRTAAEPQGESD
jgi:hypothetical protein